MSDATSSDKKFKVNDRVRRTNGTGCVGTVKDLRPETIYVGASDDKPKNIMVNVLWDNGTLSYASPVALELAKS